MDPYAGDALLNDLTSHLRSRTESQSYGESYYSKPYQSQRTPKSRSKPRSDVPDSASTTIINVMDLVTQKVIVYPFIVVRRQCQVAKFSARYHLTPFTVVHLMAKIQARQGVGALYKGLLSNLMATSLYGITVSAIAGLFDINENYLIRGLAIVIVTPFLSASTTEMVQSSIASETPGVLDFAKEGLAKWTQWTNKGTRLLPVWALIGPTVGYHLVHYFIRSNISSFCMYITYNDKNSHQIPRYREIICDLVGQLFAELILYPFDTVIMRLYLQGTRTISDNIDTGNTVMPIISSYEGAIDCFKTMTKEDGLAGSYKGLGALMLQYGIHFMILGFTKSVIRKLLNEFR